MRSILVLIALFCSTNILAAEKSANYHPERLFMYKSRVMAIPEFHAKRAPKGDSKTNTYLDIKDWLGGFDLEFSKAIRKSKVKVSEMKVIAHYNMNPNTIKKYKDLSLQLTAQMCFGGNVMPENKAFTQDNEVDALRHFFMAFLLARHYGETQARHLLLAHEAAPNIDRAIEVRNLMDLYNNEIGFEVAKEFKLPSQFKRRTRNHAKTMNDYNKFIKDLAENVMSSGKFFIWASEVTTDKDTGELVNASSHCTRSNVYPNAQKIVSSGVIQPISVSR